MIAKIKAHSKKAVSKVLRRPTLLDVDQKNLEAPSTALVRITNDTLEHRREVLGKAKKFIYPLSHSKHKIVLISSFISIVSVLSLFVYSMLGLYKFQYTSNFFYRITKALPFPVARVGSNFVEYQDYLFELNHYVYYYQNQVNADFSTEDGKKQLLEAKKTALNRAVNNEYVAILAEENKLSVTTKEVDDAVATIKSTSNLDGSSRLFEGALKNFYNWSEKDFRKSIADQLLSQKVVKAVDTQTTTKIAEVKGALAAGTAFETIAKQYSDDVSTKDLGGFFGLVDKTSKDVPPATLQKLFALQAGQVSEPIDIGAGIEIVKNLEVVGDKIKFAHIVIYYKDINEIINQKKDQNKTRLYIKL
jgi:hypothetical protein